MSVHEAIPDRVLVVRLGAIGDVVNALVFATALKRERPEMHIGWVVHPLIRPLVEGHPHVDRVHLWQRGEGLGEFRRVVNEVRATRYGLAVDLQRIQKSALLARLSGAPRVLGYDRRRAKEMSWIWSRERILPGDPRAHMVEHYLDFARYLGARRAEQEGDLHHLPPSPEAEAWARALVGELGGPPVLFNLGATKPANRWEPERFGELARCLAAELESPLAMVGGPGDRELADRARASAGEGVLHDLVGRTDLHQLAALASEARLFVTCDTGPMHLAAARGTPIVALFGAADPARTGPYGKGHRIVGEFPSCAPCGNRHCPQPRHVCMEELAVETVVEAVRASLSQAGGVPPVRRKARP